MRSRLWIIFTLLASGLAHSQNASPQPISTASFLLNPDRPFVYLEFDHLGQGVRFNEDEPPTRIWLRMVNNCRVPVRVRTFGVPTGALSGEVGVMDEVKDDEPLFTVSAGSGEVAVMDRTKQDEPLLTASSDKDGPASHPRKPSGYWGEVSSARTIAPGGEILFSIPTDHLGDHWHIEIPFTFETPKSTHPRDEVIGGEPLMRITYGRWDLPWKARKP